MDDDEQVRRSMELLFRRSPYEVCTFESARGLLNHPVDGSVACIIADLLMPEMNGIELRRELARRQIEIPFVLMTGNTDDPAAKTHPGSKIWMIEKPFRFAQLMETIDQAIQGSSSTYQHASKQTEQEAKYAS